MVRRSVARRLALGAGSLIVALISCGREITGPGKASVNAFQRFAAVAFMPQYETAVPTAALHAALLQVAFEKVRITLHREDGTIALDTLVDFPTGSDSLALSLVISLPANTPASGALMSLSLEYVNAAHETVFMGGPLAIMVLPSNGGPPAPAVLVPVHYTGPGANATAVSIAPKIVGALAGQTVNFTAQATTASGTAVSGTPIVFTSSNPAVVAIANPSSGAATLVGRGVAKVYAQLLTGPIDSATVTVLLPASRLTLFTGGGQTAPAGATLAQPVVARVTASDGVGVGGVGVSFAVASGSGSVTQGSATSAADGTVSATWKLGPAAGAQTLTVSAAGLTGSPLTVTGTALALVPTRLALTTAPASGKAGKTLAAVAVTALDANGVTVTTFTGDVSVALASNAAEGTLGGTTTVKAVNGVATFGSLVINKPGAGYTLAFASNGLAGVTSPAFDISPGAAAKLVFQAVPVAGDAGVNLAPAVVVAAQDSLGNPVPTFSSPVTISLGSSPAGATLTGTTTRSAVAGLATFGDLVLTKSGTAYTLLAAASGLTGATSPSFTVKAGVASTLGATQGAGQSRPVGSVIDPVEVQLRDAFGNGIENATIAFAVTAGGGTLSAASAVTNSLGLTRVRWTLGALSAQSMTATFRNLAPVTIKATGLPGPAAKLVIVTAPGATQTAGAIVTPAVVVLAQDAGGLPQTAFTGAVTVALASGPTGATLAGTTTVSATTGAATFAALRLPKTGTYTLSFSATGLASASTASLVVSAAPAKTIAVDSGNGQSGAAGVTLAQPFVVLVTDSLGNAVGGTSVTWAVASGGGSLSAATVATDANGRARTTLTLGPTAGSNAVTATSAGLGGSPLTFTATSTPGAATQLVIGAQPQATYVAGTNGTPIIVHARDAKGNIATTFTGAVTLAIASGPSGATVIGPTSVNAVAGVANFGGGSFDKAGTYTLRFASSGLTSVTTNSFTVGAGAAMLVEADSGGMQSGVVGTTLPTVLVGRVTDNYGNGVSGLAIVWSVTAGGGSLSGATTTTDANGRMRATFTLGPVAGTNSAKADVTAFSPFGAGFSAIGVAGAATQLAITTSAAGAANGSAFTTQPVVAVRDALGNTVTTDNSTVVTMTVSSGATVVGTAAGTAVAGVVTFSTIGISGTAGTDYTLTFAAGSLTSATQSITPTLGAVATVTVSPTTVSLAAGQTQQLTATLKDAGGNVVTGTPVTWSSSDSTTAVVSVSGLVTAANRVGTGSSTMTASSGGKSGTMTAALTVGAASRLVLTTSASGAVTGSAFTTQPVVAVRDAAGNTMTSATDEVRMTVSSGATVVGTATATAVSGVATFTNVGIGGTIGTSYTLTFASGSLTSTTQSITPTAVTFTALAAGEDHNCALTSAGAAYCWGNNFAGALGDGTATDRWTPVAVQGGVVFATVAAGGVHTCGLTKTGAAYCWGINSLGELGDGTTTDRWTPVAVQGGHAFTALTAAKNGSHACGLTSAGVAYCWGYNQLGALGDGTTTDRSTPVAVQGGYTFATLAAGADQTCGLTSTGAAYCWGFYVPEPGYGGGTTVSLTPVAVQGGLVFTNLTGGSDYTCGLTNTGAAYCWGFNYTYQLGDGTNINRVTPVAVQGGLVFTALTAADNSVCGLTGAGVAYCWGDNGMGALGDGTTNPRLTPIAVEGGLVFTALDAGGFHFCGLTSAGAAYCWGYNSNGQLGDGTTTDRYVPTAVIRP